MPPDEPTFTASKSKGLANAFVGVFLLSLAAAADRGAHGGEG
jgi:hypothetical protein